MGCCETIYVFCFYKDLKPRLKRHQAFFFNQHQTLLNKYQEK